MVSITTVDEGAVCTAMLDLYQNEGIIAEPAGALSVAALMEADVEPGSIVVCVISGGNNDVSRYNEVLERSLVHLGLKHYFLVDFPQEPGALRRFLDAVLGPNDDITLFEYVKRNNRETGEALVGIELSSAADFEPLLERLKAPSCRWRPSSRIRPPTATCSRRCSRGELVRRDRFRSQAKTTDRRQLRQLHDRLIVGAKDRFQRHAEPFGHAGQRLRPHRSTEATGPRPGPVSSNATVVPASRSSSSVRSADIRFNTTRPRGRVRIGTRLSFWAKHLSGPIRPNHNSRSSNPSGPIKARQR